MTFLNLNLENNKIGENGIKFLSNSIENLKLINSLNLNFGSNGIDQIGMNFLSKGI